MIQQNSYALDFADTVIIQFSKPNANLFSNIVIAFHSVAVFTRRQQRDISVFKSSCHLSTTRGGGFILSLLILNVKYRKAVNNFYSLGVRYTVSV